MNELISSNRAEIVLRDGTDGTPVELVIPCDAADFSISGLPPSDGNHEVEIIQSRGEICDLVEADRAIPTWSLTAYLSSLTSVTAGNVADFLRRTGAYTANQSTLGEGRRYTIDCIFRWVSEVDQSVHEWALEDSLTRLAGLTDGRPVTISIEGQVLGAHTRTVTPSP